MRNQISYQDDYIRQGTSIRAVSGVNRQPDVWVQDRITGRVKKVYEAARKAESGQWVDRELDKQKAYNKAGIPSHFEEVKDD